MSYDMKLAGRLKFADLATIQDAFSEADELVEAEAPDFQEVLESERESWFRLDGSPWSWTSTSNPHAVDLVQILV